MAAASRKHVVPMASVAPAEAPAPAPDPEAGVRFGTVLVCKTTNGCRAKLGAVHFAAPHGVVSFFACPQCGRPNHFVCDARGIRWMSVEAFAAFIAERLG